MTRLTNLSLLAASAGVLAVAGAPAVAQSTSTYVDLSAGAGYATNPFLQNDGGGSAFGRVSAHAVHARASERSSTQFSAFAENAYYTEGYGNRPLLSFDVQTQRQASERVRLFGSANFSADIGGQLSSRFVDVPRQPQVPIPGAPPPLTVQDPDLFAFTGRHYIYGGQVGAAIAAGERSSISLSGGAQRVDVTGDEFGDYTVMFGSLGYDRQLSERTSAGASLGVRRTEYAGGGGSVLIVNPTGNVRTRLSEAWDASASAGVIFLESDGVTGVGSSISPSFGGSLCRTGDTERLCFSANRDAYSGTRSTVQRTTSLGVNWFKRLDETQTVQLSASAARYTDADELGGDFASNHYRIAANYSRRLGQRMSVGADLSGRRLTRNGPDPDVDLSGAVFIRYRLGDLS